MKQVRRGLFETNSSSVHSLVIVPKEDYKAWENGELVIDKYDEELITFKELEELYRNECNLTYKNNYNSCEECFKKNGCCEWDDYRIKSFNGYYDDLDYESFERNYTTKSGDEIVAFGYYGSDY